MTFTYEYLADGYNNEPFWSEYPKDGYVVKDPTGKIVAAFYPDGKLEAIKYVERENEK